MKPIGAIFLVVFSFVPLLFYMMTDEVYFAVSAIWVLLAGIFLNGVRE